MPEEKGRRRELKLELVPIDRLSSRQERLRRYNHEDPGLPSTRVKSPETLPQKTKSERQPGLVPTSVILALGKLRQKDHRFKTSLGYHTSKK